MRIGTLAKQAQVSRDTIRYYEGLGLLELAEKHALNGYKRYTHSTLRRLHRIRYAKRLGFTLSEIREYIADWMRGEVSSQCKAMCMKKKRREVQAKIAELREIEAALSAQIVQSEQVFHF